VRFTAVNGRVRRVARFARCSGYRGVEFVGKPKRRRKPAFHLVSDWRLKGGPQRVKVHDFEDKKLGKVAPYGVWSSWHHVRHRRVRGGVSVGRHRDCIIAATAVKLGIKDTNWSKRDVYGVRPPRLRRPF
jgi:hypothetical protein